jgi:hypothetical protein
MPSAPMPKPPPILRGRVPGAPFFQAFMRGDDLQVYWEAVWNADRYRVLVTSEDGQLYRDLWVTGLFTSAVISDLPPATTLHVRVAAGNGFGMSSSMTLVLQCITLDDLQPHAPAELPPMASIGWEANGDGAFTPAYVDDREGVPILSPDLVGPGTISIPNEVDIPNATSIAPIRILPDIIAGPGVSTVRDDDGFVTISVESKRAAAQAEGPPPDNPKLILRDNGDGTASIFLVPDDRGVAPVAPSADPPAPPACGDCGRAFDEGEAGYTVKRHQLQTEQHTVGECCLNPDRDSPWGAPSPAPRFQRRPR